jgi:hypothetical protein
MAEELDLDSLSVTSVNPVHNPMLLLQTKTFFTCAVSHIRQAAPAWFCERFLAILSYSFPTISLIVFALINKYLDRY